MNNHGTTSSTTRKGLLKRIWLPGSICVAATLAGSVMLKMSTSQSDVGTQVIFSHAAITWFVAAAFIGVGTFFDLLDLELQRRSKHTHAVNEMIALHDAAVARQEQIVLGETRPYVRDETDRS